MQTDEEEIIYCLNRGQLADCFLQGRSWRPNAPAMCGVAGWTEPGKWVAPRLPQL